MGAVLAIDIGSNTTKCLFGRARAGGVEQIFERTAQARISAGRGALVAGAAEIVSGAVAAFESEARGFGENFSTVAVATSALRESPEGPSVAGEIFRLCGVRVKILGGREEARLSFAGAMSDPLVDSSSPCAYFDLGGGSLEVAFGRGGVAEKSASMPIGAVNLTREFLKDPRAPVSAGDARAIEERARAALDAGLDFPTPGFKNLVGAGGAVAAARFAKKALGLGGEENRISLPQMRALFEGVCALRSDGRAREYAVDAGRTDIVPAAFACICALMEKLGAREVVHTFCSLRCGLIISAGASCG